MKFTISREALLKPLQLVGGVVERRQTLPVLSNILLVVDGDQLSMTGTDLEVEMIGRVQLDGPCEPGSITVPAKKLMDICKSLPDNVDIDLAVTGQKVTIKGGRSRFTLSSLPASDFPNVEDSPETLEILIPQQRLRHLIERTSFAMAQQDVRYYLNGMLLELKDNELRTVATDGHRLATSVCEVEADISDRLQVIVPRKGIIELGRLLEDSDAAARLVVGSNHIRVNTGTFVFTSKLVDGKFPDYERVIPRGGDKLVIADRQELRQVLTRIAILSNEKYRGVRLSLTEGYLQVTANNPEQEEAEETLQVDYQGPAMEIGFNVNYLLDALSILNEEMVRLSMLDPNSSALVEAVDSGDSLYVIMPMRM
ncbi:DNA polymerase III subunit beta [Motiliproteus sediminis]|uniref:DNA polymerase III subunit beta n=1 Tax=Motiliproteus sediminis TaxID=1468178 RepID=UPI001AEFD64B|nr:DNA polymerase III subunit beta [Motiliproteus sediminis]